MFYIAIDEITYWGYGKTREEAIKEAAKWLINPETGGQGCTDEQINDMVISEYESRNGKRGIYLYEVTDFDLPEDDSCLDIPYLHDIKCKQDEINAK